jgi:hypothetical protein
MIIRKSAKIVILLLILIGLAPVQTRAGFGISPPYVRNESLSRGSTYEEKIYIVRNEAESEEDWKMIITPDLEGIEDWFSVDQGMEFVIPAGEEKFTIIVKVDVPKKAKYDHYTGALRIKGAVDKPFDQEGGISLAIGGRIDVDITVSDVQIVDFKVRGIKMYDMETAHDAWWGHVQGVIKLGITLENIGNVKVSPSKVELDIYDYTTGELLEQVVNYNKIAKVDSFNQEDIMSKFKTDLPAGSYRAEFRIYNGEEVVRSGDSTLSVLPYGTLPRKSMPVWAWVLIVLGIIIILGVPIFIFRKKLLELVKKILESIKKLIRKIKK